MHLKSLEGCRLTIGSYPPFSYNASGGGGEGTLIPNQQNNKDIFVKKMVVQDSMPKDVSNDNSEENKKDS